ncbi:MAG TPA: COQ9 family protein [Reyranella sp.]|nr:COQ9 family protein [Reyranella sp.]
MSPNNAENDPDSGLRDRLAEEVAAEAAFEGFGRKAMVTAAERLALPRGEADRLFPGGALQVLEYLSTRSDQRTVEALEQAGSQALKVRERIKLAVQTRIEMHAGPKETVRRALALLALPFNAPLGLKLLYRTVDALWYAAGDTSADFNFYTKRATLAGVYSSTLLYWLNDRSPGSEATWGFLDRRIDNVMSFERLKGRLRKAS